MTEHHGNHDFWRKKITIFEDFRNTLETSESFTVGDLRPPKNTGPSRTSYYMACRDGFPSRRLVSSNIPLAPSGNLGQAWPVTINTFWAHIWSQLWIPPLDLDILPSKPSWGHKVSYSEPLMLQKIHWPEPERSIGPTWWPKIMKFHDFGEI